MWTPALLIFSTALLAQSPSVAVSVIRPGKPAARTVEGFADIEAKRPASASTNYRLASVTKHFTAAAILELIGEKKIAMTTKLRDIWPDYPNPAGDAVTVRHMLTHQSGLLDYEDHLPPGEAQISDDDVVAALKAHPQLSFAPGSKFEYSNSAYVLLGKIVERVSKEPFRTFLDKRFFRPLGMQGCVVHEAGKTVVANRAYGYSAASGPGARWKRTDQSRTSATLGDGGVYCSLIGLEKWLASGRAMQSAMLEPAKLADGTVTEYGFGWFVKPDRIWHTGTTTGFRTCILRDRATNATAIVLTNRSEADAMKIAEAALAK